VSKLDKAGLVLVLKQQQQQQRGTALLELTMQKDDAGYGWALEEAGGAPPQPHPPASTSTSTSTPPTPEAAAALAHMERWREARKVQQAKAHMRKWKEHRQFRGAGASGPTSEPPVEAGGGSGQRRASWMETAAFSPRELGAPASGGLGAEDPALPAKAEAGAAVGPPGEAQAGAEPSGHVSGTGAAGNGSNERGAQVADASTAAGSVAKQGANGDDSAQQAPEWSRAEEGQAVVTFEDSNLPVKNRVVEDGETKCAKYSAVGCCACWFSLGLALFVYIHIRSQA